MISQRERETTRKVDSMVSRGYNRIEVLLPENISEYNRLRGLIPQRYDGRRSRPAAIVPRWELPERVATRGVSSPVGDWDSSSLGDNCLERSPARSGLCLKS
ncbi:RNA polymerase sigma factor RpoD [Striga asiatica]|uniref:RNA polymerase sigma factor RpoD n=1 Tax=Striga asiatica TaxID=4170 RepID=A0A5A7QTJ1_STRAF|nr:RNA polymerase sigma factor RpoD [Striga asiatica]